MEYTKFTGYIGTYTKGESQGIYTFVLDTQEKITDVQLAGTLENPTYLTITKDQRFLYSVLKEGTKGGVASYTIQPDSSRLSLINKQLAEGSPPCHVCTDSQQRYLFSANYHKGTVESYLIDQHTGEISAPVSVIAHVGSVQMKDKKAHTHLLV